MGNFEINTLYPHFFFSFSDISSVCGLDPVYYRYPGHRPLSCYAFFKEWLLPSLSRGCEISELKAYLKTQSSIKDHLIFTKPSLWLLPQTPFTGKFRDLR